MLMMMMIMMMTSMMTTMMTTMMMRGRMTKIMIHTNSTTTNQINTISISNTTNNNTPEFRVVLDDTEVVWPLVNTIMPQAQEAAVNHKHLKLSPMTHHARRYTARNVFFTARAQQ
jgi:hypothetical protein